MKKIGEGRVAEIFEWEPGTVVKIYRSPDDDKTVAAEADITRRVHAVGAPVPRCDGLVRVNGRTGLVLERLDGPSMGDALLAGRVDEVAHELGVLHADIHLRSGDGFPSMSDRVISRAERSLPQDLTSAIRRLVFELADGDRLLHGDLHPYNVVSDDTRWMAIDWDNAYSGPPAADVARTVFLIREAGFVEDMPRRRIRHQAAAAYLAGYRSRAEMPEALVDAWRLPVIAARLDEGVPEERARLIGVLRDRLTAT